MVLCQKSPFRMPLSFLIICIWISIATLGVMASKNLWDTLGETVDPNDDPETYEKNLCSNPLVDCYGCQKFNDDSTNCSLQPDCWYNCEASKCLNITEFDEKYTCSYRFCDKLSDDVDNCRLSPECWYNCEASKCQNITEFDEKYTCSQYCDDDVCHCLAEPKCYYVFAEKKCRFVEQCHEGAYDLKQNFESNDCIRGSAMNTFHLIGGSACASDVPNDTGNCEVGSVFYEAGSSGNSGISVISVNSAIVVPPNGRYEYQLTINNVNWDTGDLQFYKLKIQDEPMLLKLSKTDFENTSQNVRVVVSVVTQEGIVFIRGYKGPQAGFPLKEGKKLSFGSLAISCSNVGDKANKFHREKFQSLKES